jgi:hypothetical protein
MCVVTVPFPNSYVAYVYTEFVFRSPLALATWNRIQFRQTPRYLKTLVHYQGLEASLPWHFRSDLYCTLRFPRVSEFVSQNWSFQRVVQFRLL